MRLLVSCVSHNPTVIKISTQQQQSFLHHVLLCLCLAIHSLMASLSASLCIRCALSLLAFCHHLSLSSASSLWCFLHISSLLSTSQLHSLHFLMAALHAGLKYTHAFIFPCSNQHTLSTTTHLLSHMSRSSVLQNNNYGHGELIRANPRKSCRYPPMQMIARKLLVLLHMRA